MAGKVIVDIPGIGAIEAENAATESTLRELVNVMKQAQKGAPGGGSTGGSKAAGKVLTPLTKAVGSENAKGSVVGKLKMLGGSALVLGSKLIDTANAAARMLGSISDLDNSVSGAARSIPLVGGFFGEIAAASEKLVDAFQTASGSGAGFGGSVQAMSSAAATAGMTLQQYSQFISKNGDALRLLGGTVDSGARRFKDLGREMRSSGMMMQLNTLGFTSEQVNEGMASYASILGRTGKLQNMTTAQLAQRSANYMKEIDKLAKATGQEREQIEENQAKLLADAQFQAKVASMGVEAGDALRNTITGLPEPLQDIAKDIIGTGTATTEASEQFIATMPESARLMQRFNQITEEGGTITDEMQQQLQNTLREEGAVRRQQFRDQGRYNNEMADTYMAMVSAANIQRDALENAADEQENQIEATDGAVAGMEAMRRKINEVSIEFTNILASSGLLGSMMNAFGFFTNFLKAIVVPVFNILGTAINIVVMALKPLGVLLGLFGDLWTTYVSPAFAALNRVITGLTNVVEPLYKYIGLNLLKAFYFIGDTIQDFVQPAFDMISRVVQSVATYLQETWTPIFQNIGNWFQTTFIEPFQTATEYIANILQPAFDTLGSVVGWVAEKFDAVYTAITDFFDSFRTLDDVVTAMSLTFDGIALGFRELMMDLGDGISSLPFMGRDAEEAAEAAREREQLLNDQLDLERRKIEWENRAQQNIQMSRSERAADDEERAAARATRDAELDASIQQSANEMFDAIGFAGVEATERNIEDQYEAAEEAARNYSDPIAILGSELERQNSAILDMDTTGRRSLEPTDSGDTSEPLTIPIEYDPTDPNSSSTNPSGGATPQEEVARQLALNTSAMEEMVALQRATLRALNRNVAATEGLDSRVI